MKKRFTIFQVLPRSGILLRRTFSSELINFQMENKWQMINDKWKIPPRGFTLIELILVIAIIGILSSVIMVNLLEVRQRGRDTKRKYDLSQIQSAAELYRSDQGQYPAGLGACGSQLTDGGSKVYLQKIPCDPSTKLLYIYVPFGTTYTLQACLENLKDPNLDNPGSGACSYTVRNP